MKENTARDRAAGNLTPITPMWGGKTGTAFPKELIGATILFIGSRNEEVKLVIDYAPAGTASAMRMTLGFSELGMWCEGNTPCPAPNRDEDLQ